MATDRFEKLREHSEVIELRRALSSTQEQLIRAQAKNVQIVNTVYEAAFAAAAARAEPPSVPVPQRDRRKGRAEVALLHLSDWQVGKRTESYDMDTARVRTERLAAKVAKLTSIERADHPVREMHVLLGGDMVEGVTIFPGQRWELDASAFQQVFTAADILENYLRQMLVLYEKLVVWSVTGNHGFMGKRGDHPVEDNLDAFVYRIVRDGLLRSGDRKRLEWHDPERWYSIAKIGKYRLLLFHGHQIKSFGGQTPAFGIARRVNGWATGVLPHFSDAYGGHFHQPLVIPLANSNRCFISPSLESSNEYAAEFMAATGVSAQRLHFVDPEKGRLTAERLVYLES